MDKIKVEDFEKYAKDNGWMLVNEASTPTGRQVRFITPQGNFPTALYNINGQDVDQLSPPPPVVMMQGAMPQMGSRLGLDPRGGGPGLHG